jgi:hypothetical protein
MCARALPSVGKCVMGRHATWARRRAQTDCQRNEGCNSLPMDCGWRGYAAGPWAVRPSGIDRGFVKHKRAVAAGGGPAEGASTVANERARTGKAFREIAQHVTRFQPRSVPPLSKEDAGGSRRSSEGEGTWGEVTSGLHIRAFTIWHHLCLLIQIVVIYYALLVAPMLLRSELDDSGIMHAKT